MFLNDHSEFMRKAIAVAVRNPQAPFGAILVEADSGRIVAEGHNRARGNPILHGEMDAINNYASNGGDNWKILRLYTTAEPCCMCQSAIIWAGIPEVIFGTSISKLIELGWRQFDMTAQQVVDRARFSRCRIVGGVLAGDCDLLFIDAKRR